jgi:NAD(P)-dependent dehydrogenase (short-subunit alcohol dehydrogenase family)
MIKQNKGKIINISSGVPKSPASPLWLPYSVSKGAVYTLTNALARSLGPSGINVNSIAPGYTASEASLAQVGYKDIEDATIAARCIPRGEKPQDLIGPAVFLASDASDFISGQIQFVDGGATIQ